MTYPKKMIFTALIVFLIMPLAGLAAEGDDLTADNNSIPTSEIIFISPDPAMEGESVSFLGTGSDSDGTIINFSWSSDKDGHLSDLGSFSANSLSAGTHTITFKVQDNISAWSDAVSKSLTVEEAPNQKPLATIDSISPNPATEGDYVLFKGSGSDSDGEIVNYSWSSNKAGQLSNSRNFYTNNLSAGQHIIIFKIQDNDGEWSDEELLLLVVDEAPNQVPVATIKSITPNPATEGSEIVFEGNGTDEDGTIKAYLWTLDGSELSKKASFNTSYITAGTHTIAFSVQDNKSTWSEEDTKELVINETLNVKPVGNIESITPNPAIQNRSVTFSGSGSDTDGTIVAYYWDSDINGYLSSSPSFNTSNLSAGNHTIYFTVQDDKGFWSEIVSAYLVINDTPNKAPLATIGSISPNPGKEHLPVYFTGEGNDSDGTIAGYYWYSSLDDLLSTSASFNTTNLSIGNHIISFRVTDNEGSWSETVYSTLSISTSSGGSSGGGSSSSSSGSSSAGSGGGSSAEKYENILIKEAQIIFVNRGEHIVYEFRNEENALQTIQFDSLKNSGKIQTTIEVLNDTSLYADKDAPGNVYQQMNIWVGKTGFINTDNVENLSINFRVKKDWLENNGIEYDAVKMYRYSDDAWSSLPTFVTEEDDEYVYFESETAGFSPFVISSETKTTKTVVEDKTESTSTVEENLKSIDTVSTNLIADEQISDAETGSTRSTGYTIIIILGVIVVMGIVVYLVRKYVDIEF